MWAIGRYSVIGYIMLSFNTAVILSVTLAKAEVMAHHSFLQAQNEIQYIDLGRSDSLIRMRHPNLKLSDSYYVFLYPTMGAVTTFAPPIIKEYNALTKKGVRQCNEDILFVFKNNGGIPERLIPQLMKQAFLWDDKTVDSVKYVVDDSLYDQLNLGGELSKLMYIYRSKLVYNQVCKLHTIYNQPIPHSKFELDGPKYTLLHGVDTMLLMERDPLYRYTDGKLLVQGDVKDELFAIDTKTGAVDKSFTFQNQDPTDFYCKYFAKDDPARCNFAKSWAPYVKSMNRQCVNVFNVVYAKPYIYLYVSVEAYERNEKKFSQYDAESKKSVVKHAEPILTAHGVMAMLDTNFNVLKIIKQQEWPVKGKRETFWMFDVGFYRNNQNKLVTQSVVDPSPRHKTPALAYFDFGDTLLSLIDNSKGKTTPKELFKGVNNLKTFYFKLNDKELYCTDIFGDIHDQNSGKILGRLEGDGTPLYKKEVFITQVEQTKKEKINYAIHDMAPIYNGQYLATIYKYKGKPLLEIKDTSLKTVDVIDLSKYPGLQHYFSNPIMDNILIQNDTIYLLVLKDDQYYLESYKINKPCGL